MPANRVKNPRSPSSSPRRRDEKHTTLTNKSHDNKPAFKTGLSPLSTLTKKPDQQKSSQSPTRKKQNDQQESHNSKSSPPRNTRSST